MWKIHFLFRSLLPTESLLEQTKEDKLLSCLLQSALSCAFARLLATWHWNPDWCCTAWDI